ncbi:efflux RND transporter permease subunit [Paenibacillus sp.]|uniref:efflux RND transporter permease subunit n=1 Tax=Paenibacillus sp. TaxID=58172 RepID=UPI002D520102|nr:efflux RND transporter permease subunit [Paenibacillus sp.]HZG57704.1 efflux RND transporter permease subunit [Paenibacillus sp.]
MRGIIRFSLNNRFAVLILTIIVTVAGLYAGLNMKQETLPNLEVPYLQITAVYPGAAPEEVAESITGPAEQRLLHLPGVKTVNSSSMENVSAITIEYDYGVDMDKAAAEAREALELLSLPSGAQEPTVSRISLNAFPVVSLSVADPNGSLEELTKLVEREIQPALEGLDGVASVQIAGQYVTEVSLRFDAEALRRRGLTEDAVKGVVQASAFSAPLGLYELGNEQKTIVVDGGVKTIEDLENVPIPIAGPTGLSTVPLKEVATLAVTGRSESISRTNGSESIGIQIVKAQDANTVDVVNAVKDEAASLRDRYPTLEVTTLLDQGEPIEQSVKTMLEKAAFGALFAILIILLFLRNVRSTIISVVSIPLSLLIGVLLLQQLDITLNMMTLGAMTVAIGRVVDDSIVVIENIYRRMSLPNESLKGKALILDATREMFIPILSSTIVTIAVFLPLGAVSGMVGELFLPFALTMVFALLASLLVAITVVPAMGFAMFKNGLKGKAHDEAKVGRLAGAYKRALRWTLDHKTISIVVSFALLFGSFALVPAIGVSFLPEEEQKYAMVSYTPAPGERLADVEAIALQAETLLLKDERVTNFQYSVGGSNPMSPGPSRSALFYIQYPDDTEAFEDVKNALVDALAEQAPGEGEWGQMDFSGGFGGAGLNLHVYGDTMEEIEAAIADIQGLMEDDGRFENIESSLSETYGQYTLVADKEKLSGLGLTPGQLVLALSPSRERPVLTNVEIEGKTYEVVVAADPKTYGSIEDIERTTVASPLGFEVAVGDVVDVVEGDSPDTVTRKDGRLYGSVSADITAKDVAKASSDLEAAIDAKLTLPPTVDVEFGGVAEQINETFAQLGLAMAAAIAIVYLVLVVTFGGGLAPFAILLSLPFAIIGALLALLIAGETISVSAMMGALMLIGIVVTNAIVLVDRVIRKEKEGLSTREALLEAAATRLRPILMTALATIGALLPLAFGLEGAGIISKGLGVTVIGGLASSTALTLVIVPIAYELLMKLRKGGIEESI